MTKNCIDTFICLLGPAGVLTAPEDRKKYETDWRLQVESRALAVLRPQTVAEIQSIVHVCREARISITPQGGNTGLVGGGLASKNEDQVLLSLERMNRIREIEPKTGICIADAGCITANLQKAALDKGWQWPLSLASEGSCTLGGNIATNAGGIRALKYGVMRDSVLGLEVVTADGDILNDLSMLKKDNTGLSLRNLFIGSEGTLGIITAASIQMFPIPKAKATALVALANAEAALELLIHLRTHFGREISAFEFLSIGIMQVFERKHRKAPLDLSTDAYVLLEIDEMEMRDNLTERLENCLTEAFEAKLISDAVLCHSEAQRQELWWIREHLPDIDHELQIHTDIAVPVSALPKAEILLNEAVNQAAPSGCKLCYYGHFGDGNLHYNVFLENSAEKFAVLDAIMNTTASLGGSISAEHGIGRTKVSMLKKYKDRHALNLMHKVRYSLDKARIFNPEVMLSNDPPTEDSH